MQIHPFKAPPPKAQKYANLNKDVLEATNKGNVDGAESPAELANCYSPTESISKAKQEKLSRDETTKVAGVHTLNETQLARFRQETSHLTSITHPDVVHDIVARIFSPDEIMTISNACDKIPIR